MPTRRTVLAGSVAMAASLAGCVVAGDRPRDVEERRDERYGVDEVDVLAARTREGDVTTTAAEGETIEIRAAFAAASEEGLEAIDLEAESADGRLELAVDRDEWGTPFGLGGLWHEPPPKVDLDIAVPDDVEVERLEARNGTVTVADVDVSAVETRNGNIDVAGVGGDLDAKTRNGTVDVRDVRENLRVESRNGAIEVDGVGGDLVAAARNGTVDVAGIEGDVDVETRNGAVRLEVADDLDAIVEVTTRNGTITVDVGDLSTTTAESFSATVGDGERRIAVATRNGNVEIQSA